MKPVCVASRTFSRCLVALARGSRTCRSSTLDAKRVLVSKQSHYSIYQGRKEGVKESKKKREKLVVKSVIIQSAELIKRFEGAATMPLL